MLQGHATHHANLGQRESIYIRLNKKPSSPARWRNPSDLGSNQSRHFASRQGKCSMPGSLSIKASRLSPNRPPTAKHDEQVSHISLNFQHQSYPFSVFITRPTMPQKHAISRATWESHRAELQILYQEKSLREVITYMEENHRFMATLLSFAFFPSSNS